MIYLYLFILLSFSFIAGLIVGALLYAGKRGDEIMEEHFKERNNELSNN